MQGRRTHKGHSTSSELAWEGFVEQMAFGGPWRSLGWSRRQVLGQVDFRKHEPKSQAGAQGHPEKEQELGRAARKCERWSGGGAEPTKTLDRLTGQA